MRNLFLNKILGKQQQNKNDLEKLTNMKMNSLSEQFHRNVFESIRLETDFISK